MGTIETSIHTNLSVKDCAQVFRESATAAQGLGSKMSAGFGKARGARVGIEFYTPTDDSPFAQFEEDEPTVMIGVHIPRMYGGAAGESTNIQMHVWDRTHHRDVVLISEHKVTGGGHARKLISKVCDAFQRADSGCRISS